MIEKNFDIPFVANLARREKQVQQNYRPIIAVHKWFARRPGTLFRALLLSEFSEMPLPESFYTTGNLSGKTIADPFMGGGTPILEANRLGADVIGCDINPMAYWIVRQEIEYLDLAAYKSAALAVRSALEEEVGHLYKTRCEICGDPEAHVKYFLWVKTMTCRTCGRDIDLFPGHLVAENVRHPKNVFICSACGRLTETADRRNPGRCGFCRNELRPDGPAKRNKCRCGNCGDENQFPFDHGRPPKHRLFALEYICYNCKNKHKGRFFKSPDSNDLARVLEAEKRAAELQSEFIPNEVIPSGDETNRLRRWGYFLYRELFSARQLLGLEQICRLVRSHDNESIRRALATNLSDLLRYQNMLCRYDTMALKSLDIFSVHGFPVSLVQCESNLIGISGGGGLPAGSGGWFNIVEKFTKAKTYCQAPFEIRHHNGSKTGGKDIIPIKGEWIGDRRKDGKSRKVDLSSTDAASRNWRKGSLDAVLTDPPYFGNVQYAELMDFCYIWLRRLIHDEPAFSAPTTRNRNELTGNATLGRDYTHFAAGLSAVFAAAASALKPRAPFVFTYHHNDLAAYFPVAAAILDGGLICSAVLPCPAEMAASIHINGTVSSTVDSVFVCRRQQDIPPPKKYVLEDALARDLEALRQGGLKITPGDSRCVLFGQVIRKAINDLARLWNKADHTTVKLNKLTLWLETQGGLSAVKALADKTFKETEKKPTPVVRPGLFPEEAGHAATTV